MRFVVAALVAFFVFVPAAHAQVTFTGVPATPTNLVTFDIGFSAPDADDYQCEHIFPDLTSETVACNDKTFPFRDVTDGRHELKVTAAGPGGVQTGSIAIVVDTVGPPPPTIETAVIDGRTATLSGTTTAATTVAVFEGTTKLGDATKTADTTWEFAAMNLAEGPHRLTAVAYDAAGNPSDASEPRDVTIDTGPPGPPTIDLPEKDAVNQRMITLAGTTEPGTTLAVFDGGVELLPKPVPSGGTWVFTTPELAEGAHTFKVVATNVNGHTSEASRTITVDTVPPAPVEPVQTGTSEFTFFTGEAGATFECAVDGGGFAPCTSPQRLSGLAAGEHTFAVVAIDAAGNRSAAAARSFSIAAPPAATPEPTPAATVVATPSAFVPPPALPAAELGRTLVARTVSGKVYVRRPATAAPLDLGIVAAIPVGTEIDARKGRVRLTAAATRGKASHRAEFFGGVFVVTQSADDIVDLRLSQPFGSCAKKTGTRVRKLWGDGRGRFRTYGLNSVATVRATRWLVQDSCEGTLTRVSQGLVSVRDRAKRKTFLVRAGRKYLAVPKKRK
jgi:hypothetical protein